MTRVIKPFLIPEEKSIYLVGSKPTLESIKYVRPSHTTLTILKFETAGVGLNNGFGGYRSMLLSEIEIVFLDLVGLVTPWVSSNNHSSFL